METQEIPEPMGPMAEVMPQELADTLVAMVGQRPNSFKKEFKLNTKAYPKFSGAAFGGESSQEEFLKKRDPVEKKIRYECNEINVLDLTDPKQKEKYQAVLDIVGDPESGVILAEELKDPQILLDPNSPMGYRAIVVIKTSKPKLYLKKKGEGYQVQKRFKGRKEDVDE